MATQLLNERYARALRPFTDAGWQIEFNDQAVDQVLTIAGRHPVLATQFHTALDRRQLDDRSYMEHQIHRAWLQVQRTEADRWPFTPMRVYPSATTVFEPKDWYQFIEFMGFQSFNRELITDENFRRRNRIVLASPFSDKYGNRIYEMDKLWIRNTECRMGWDAEANAWHVHTLEGEILEGLSAKAALRDGNIYDYQ